MSALRVTCRIAPDGLLVRTEGGSRVPDGVEYLGTMCEAWTAARLASEAEADATRDPEPGW